jgi:hypothetical protein
LAVDRSDTASSVYNLVRCCGDKRFALSMPALGQPQICDLGN